MQSTTISLLIAEDRLPRIDAAVFADTQSEPAEVYRHLARLENEVLAPAGIPVHRVTEGCLTDDALDPQHRFASMPLYVRNQDGSEGMMRRQCTSEYKLTPIKKRVRGLLGYPHPARVPAGVFAEMWIGFSRDEVARVRDSDVRYMRNTFPLIDLGWRRSDCERFLAARGFAETPKSACWACAFHGNRQWRHLRDHAPADWAKAVAFDRAIRSGGARATAEGKPLPGQAFLHRSRLPLDQAPIDKVTWAEWKNRQGDLLDALAEIDVEAP